jgi:hypothetical protein
MMRQGHRIAALSRRFGRPLKRDLPTWSHGRRSKRFELGTTLQNRNDNRAIESGSGC